MDDVLPPCQPRSVVIKADAELLPIGGETIGPGFAPEVMRLWPVESIAWSLEGGPLQISKRTVK